MAKPMAKPRSCPRLTGSLSAFMTIVYLVSQPYATCLARVLVFPFHFPFRPAL